MTMEIDGQEVESPFECRSQWPGCGRDDCGWPDQPCAAGGVLAASSVEEVGPEGNEGRRAGSRWLLEEDGPESVLIGATTLHWPLGFMVNEPSRNPGYGQFNSSACGLYRGIAYDRAYAAFNESDKPMCKRCAKRWSDETERMGE